MTASPRRSGPPAVIVYGADPALRSTALTGAIDVAVGDAERALALEQSDLATVLGCADALPMFCEHRVLVARSAQDATADELARLLAYLGDPAPTTEVVVEWAAATLPAKWAKAAGGAGATLIDANPARNASGRATAVNTALRSSSVNLDGPARAAVIEVLGEDVGRVGAIVALLESAFAPGTTLGLSQVRPHLGPAGPGPSWDLTDALDGADAPRALRVLARLLDAGARHPLQVLAALVNHYDRIFRVAALAPPDEAAAAAALGIKGSTFPAKKALVASRRLGPSRAEAAMELLGAAGAALKGGSGVPDRLVVEILVGRLAALARR